MVSLTPIIQGSLEVTQKPVAALAHDIKGLLALLGWREPSQALSSG